MKWNGWNERAKQWVILTIKKIKLIWLTCSPSMYSCYFKRYFVNLLLLTIKPNKNSKC